MATEDGIQLGKLIWSEDDALRQMHDPDRETIEKKWLQLFGEEFDSSKAVAKEDRGDHFVYLMPNGYGVVFAFDGDYIYEPKRGNDGDG